MNKTLLLAVMIIGVGMASIGLRKVSVISRGVSKPIRPMRVLLGNSGKRPYAETAPADSKETFNAAVLGQLITRTGSFELQPGLLKAWRWNHARRSYALTMRDDINFHNGRHATAEDLEFTLLRGFFSQHQSFYRLFLSNIVGVESIKPGTQYSSGAVSGVSIVGPYTVEVQLKAPNPGFLFNIGFGYFSLVPREELEDNYIEWKRHPVGAGSYKIVEKNEERGWYALEYVKREADANVPFRVDVYTSDSASEGYDVIAFTDPPGNVDAYHTVNSTYPDRVWTIFFSNQNEAGTNAVFRDALKFGIDREALVFGVASHRPAVEMLPRHFWGRFGLESPYDLEKARALFASLPSAIRDRVFRIPVFAGASIPLTQRQLLDRLRAQCLAFGLRLEMYPSQAKFISQDMAVKLPFEIAGMVVHYTDPNLMFAAFREASPFRFTKRPREPDEKFEALYITAQLAEDMPAKRKAIQALSEYFDSRVMAVPLWESSSRYFFNAATIESLGEQDMPLYLYFDRIRAK